MSEFYCAAPWRGLHVNPNGDVKTCCAGDPNMLGNLNNHTIGEILNGAELKKIRESIRQGQPHRYCINCVQAEKYGDSERNWHNSVNHDFDVASADLDSHIPTLVDVRWNTTCNLSCNYCGEKCSSKWAMLKKMPIKSSTRNYFLEVCDYLEQHQSAIREVALVGGEPLLLPENERLLDVISKTAIVTLITNLSVDLHKNKIFQKLSTRNKVGWSMSFDNIGSRLEYVRHGANWAQIQENLKIIKNLMTTQGHWGGIHAVYNIYNATRVCELRQFAQDANVTVLWQNLFQPEYLNPFLHGSELAQQAIAEIERFYEMNIATPVERQFFDQALQTYRQKLNGPKATNIDFPFQKHIQEIENRYHQDKAGEFKRLWPELVFLCK